MGHRMGDRVYLAANNPDLGGGELMLVRHAEALLSLGHPVTVVAPDSPAEVLDAASTAGADVAAIRADSRRDYLRRLRAWDRRERSGLLWCHGLVPALATAGHRNRIVHLHQVPRSRAQRAALVVARRRALRLLTPSDTLAELLPGAVALPNWTADSEVLTRAVDPQGTRIGFLGRLSVEKGVDVLARAVGAVGADRAVELVVAGDDRWVPTVQSAPVAAALAELGGAVVRLGHVPPATLFAQVDLAVFPSRVPESFGLVVAEAMASGVPFVISDAGALPEVAGPDHPWIARRGDADDLARVIAEALATPQDTVQQLTTAARQRWETEYSPRAGRQRVSRLLDELGIR